jgi:hypothetical protein
MKSISIIYHIAFEFYFNFQIWYYKLFYQIIKLTGLQIIITNRIYCRLGNKLSMICHLIIPFNIVFVEKNMNFDDEKNGKHKIKFEYITL